MKMKLAVVVVALGVLSGSGWCREVVEGRVVNVSDGDTVVMLVGREQMKIRLASIDAPESSHTNKERGKVGQPYANNAKAALVDLVKGNVVRAECHQTDRYGRSVCDLYTMGGLWVNGEMVKRGMAWPYMGSGGRYLRDKGLVDIARDAKARGVGLWSMPRPVEPWLWRKTCWQEGHCPQ